MNGTRELVVMARKGGRTRCRVVRAVASRERTTITRRPGAVVVGAVSFSADGGKEGEKD
jgi:hypothetical protein